MGRFGIVMILPPYNKCDGHSELLKCMVEDDHSKQLQSQQLCAQWYQWPPKHLLKCGLRVIKQKVFSNYQIGFTNLFINKIVIGFIKRIYLIKNYNIIKPLIGCGVAGVFGRYLGGRRQDYESFVYELFFFLISKCRLSSYLFGFSPYKPFPESTALSGINCHVVPCELLT